MMPDGEIAPGRDAAAALGVLQGIRFEFGENLLFPARFPLRRFTAVPEGIQQFQNQSVEIEGRCVSAETGMAVQRQGMAPAMLACPTDKMDRERSHQFPPEMRCRDEQPPSPA